jgi:hypothetical protein
MTQLWTPEQHKEGVTGSLLTQFFPGVNILKSMGKRSEIGSSSLEPYGSTLLDCFMSVVYNNQPVQNNTVLRNVSILSYKERKCSMTARGQISNCQ